MSTTSTTPALLERVTELRQVAPVLTQQLDQQLLFEKWVPRESWSIRDEAIPLLCACDPELWIDTRKQNSVLGEHARALWEMMQDPLARQGIPINASEPPEAWQAAPASIYRWASLERLSVSPAFEQLIQFIQKVIPSTPDVSGEPPSAPMNAEIAGLRDREIVLGAALNVVIKCSHEVRDEMGLVDGAKVVGLINAQRVRWFGDQSCSLSDDEMARLIDKWLE